VKFVLFAIVAVSFGPTEVALPGRAAIRAGRQANARLEGKFHSHSEPIPQQCSPAPGIAADIIRLGEVADGSGTS
jgi:hypothetical protein